MAEEEGFEPSVQLPIRHISNVLVSTTPPEQNRLAEGERFEVRLEGNLEEFRGERIAVSI